MLASVLKRNNATIDICADIAYELKQDNALFDFDRFMEACGYTVSKKV